MLRFVASPVSGESPRRLAGTANATPFKRRRRLQHFLIAEGFVLRYQEAELPMRLLKRLLFFTLLLIAVLLIVSLFLPSQVRVERSAVIAAPADRIFEQVNTLTNWEKWSPWHKLDPNMKLQYSGPPSGKGAAYAWQSTQRNVGNGTLTIDESTPPQRVGTAMHFDAGDAAGSFTFQPLEKNTRVTWVMDSNMGKNPVGKFFGLMMDRMVGPDFERGLNNLKTLCEAR